MKQFLFEIPSPVLLKASESICHTIAQHLKTLTPSSQANIAIFSPLPHEIHLQQLHHLLPQANLLYPLCHTQRQLSFHHVSIPHSLQAGRMGILEPSPLTHPEIPISEIDLFICPGLAFGKDFTRLGYGGGFYDNALRQQKKSSLNIGVALHSQIVESIPLESHDILMNRLITEQGILSPSL